MNVRLNHILARQRTAELQHAGEQARLAREVRVSDRKRPCPRPVMLRGTTVVTVTGKIDGRALVPGSYRLLATLATDGIAGQQQQTTFEIAR
jgi:hypothetical protein